MELGKSTKRENDIMGYTISGYPITRKMAREIHEVAPVFMGDPDIEGSCCGFTQEQLGGQRDNGETYN